MIIIIYSSLFLFIRIEYACHHFKKKVILMTFKKAIFYFIFFMLTLVLPAQNRKIVDSLEHVFSKTKDIESKINLLWSLSDQFLDSNTSKALAYGHKAYTLAESSSDIKAKIVSNLFLAKTYFFLSDLNKAMKHALNAKVLATENNLDFELANSLDAIGMIYYDIGNQAKSSENFYASLKIYEKLKDKNGLGATFCRIGTLYLDQKDYDKAVEYYTKSINLAKEINSDGGIASNLNNLAKVYSEQKEYDKALKSYEEALRINLKSGNSYLAGNNYLNIAEVYLKRKQYEAAMTKVQQARRIFEKLGNKLRLAKSQVILGEIFLETGQFSQSESFTLSALKIAEANGYYEIIVSASGVLNKLFLSRKDSATAFRYFILEKKYQDSLLLDEKQKTLAKLELKYQFEQSEESARVARQRRNIAIIVISGCLFFSLIIIILILKQLKLKAKKLQLEQASHEQELEFKNKEMVLNVMSLMKKNEMLADLSEKLIHIEEESTSADSKETIKKVARELQKSQEDEIWKEFSHRFKEVHGEFYDKLLQKFPTLTPNELKLCAFLRLNMSSKDIAELTGQRVSSLETARYRLRQKLGIANSEVNLITFLSSL
jgi:tetratricopeptide (TPR) repeat protein